MSYGSEKDNRAPTFDMDLSDFFDSNGDPISYEAARQYFEQDSSQKYVVKHFALSKKTIMVSVVEHAMVAAPHNPMQKYLFFGYFNYFLYFS